MELTRHQTLSGPRWAVNGRWLPRSFDLRMLLALPWATCRQVLREMVTEEQASGPLLAPLEPSHEVWASGVTYRRSRDARQAESETGDIYALVYQADRPELFLKAIGWRVVGPDMPVRIRRDSGWNVPEPEMTIVINRVGEIVGYCAGNDLSSRDIEGANPLYLPQAKVYRGSCALGPGLKLVSSEVLSDLEITLEIARGGEVLFADSISTARMKRGLEELVSYLYRELDFPYGAFLMTGTGIVPPDDFSLLPGDRVRVTVGELVLENTVTR